MAKYFIILLLLISTTGVAQTDWLNLPLFRGVGYGEISDSTATFTITGQQFTVDNGSVTASGGGGFGGGNGLKIYNSSNITIDHCLFRDIYNLGVYLFNCSNITIQNCVFVNCSWGTMTEQCGNNIKINDNVVMDMYGQKVVSGQGPYRGQAIYFVGTTGSGIEVARNKILNHVGENFSEDIISTHTSAGTSGSHLLIHDNVIWGGGPGTNGVGIIAGDGTSQWVDIYNNRIGQVAIFCLGVAGGSDINVHDNMAFGERSIWTGGPYYAYANPSPCSNITFANNSNYVVSKQDNLNDNFFNGSCTSSSIASPTSLGANLAAAYANFTAGISSGFPNSIVFTLLTEDQMWRLRATKYRSADIVAHGNRTGNGGDAPQKVDLTRPTANAGPDQPSVVTSTASLDGTATVSTQPSGLTGFGVNTISGVLWIQVSGPNTSTIVSPTNIDTNVSGLITGTYVYRVEVTQNLTYNNNLITTGTADISYFSSHADWVTLNVTTSGSYRSKGRIF